MASWVRVLENESDYEKSEDAVSDLLQEVCSICGDVMTGKHYGASSCDGCKGFFRRSVRKNIQYICMFSRNCIIDKQKRNQCRYCRLKKCFKAGMKKEAVQMERDRINPKRPMKEPNSLTAYHFMKAEVVSRLDKISVNPQQEQKNDIFLANRQVGSIHDMCEVLKEHLLRLTQWAMSIPAFLELSLDDQVALLRGHGGEHFILWLARNSLGLTNIILLGEDYVIPKYEETQDLQTKIDLRLIATRILNEIVKLLAEDQADKAELSLLQGIIFFDPYLKGLEDRKKVHSIRSQIIINLEDYVSENQYEDNRGRFGDFLLLLPVLQSINQEMVEHLTLASLYGVIEIDSLVQEMLLEGITYGSVEFQSSSDCNLKLDNLTIISPPISVDDLPSSPQSPEVEVKPLDIFKADNEILRRNLLNL